jgi:hypothetical protein
LRFRDGSLCSGTAMSRREANDPQHPHASEGRFYNTGMTKSGIFGFV